MSSIPALQDVFRAQKVIANFLPRTPMHNYPALDQVVGTEIYVKHENYQPIGVFKVRGGINLVAGLSHEEKKKGLITASTGNHGQSVAYSAKLFGVKATIVVPEDANRVKVQAMESLGARIVFHGRDFDDARAEARRLGEARGMRFVSSGNEPKLVAGVATYTLEIFEDLPDVQVIIVPVGGGSGASGVCLVARGLGAKTEIIAVQASKAPSAYLTWKNQKPIEAKMETEAEGLATRAPFMLPQEILWRFLDDFVLVDDEDMRASVRLYLEKAKTLSELAGAAPLAAALKLKDHLRGKKVVLVLSGGNISPEKLREILSP